MTVGKPVIVPSRRWLHVEQGDPFAVHEQFHFVRPAETLDVFVAVTRQANRDLVLSVDGKRVRNKRSAARADRKSTDMALLR